MSQPQNELETIRQRARQAVEYYKRQVNSSTGDKTGNTSRPSLSASPQTYHRSLDMDTVADQYERVGGQLQAQRSSMEDILHGGVVPASSNSFYRAQMKAGIIDMRSSYNERIGSGSAKQRSRTFHGPHTGRTRTQTYAVDPHKSRPSAMAVAKPRDSPKSSHRLMLASPPSPSPPQHYPQHAAAAIITKAGGSKRSGRGLYRSNSNLEMDSVEYKDDDLPPTVLHREYGSTSSLDILASSQDNYADVLKDFKNGNPPPRDPRLRQLLQQQHNTMNGTAEKEDDEGSDHGRSKNKSKSKDRKIRAKSITGDSSSTGILKKLRGGSSRHDAGDVSSKPDDRCNEDSLSEEKVRQKVFTHFDCQSIGVRLSKSNRVQTAANLMKNITTGASAASVKRNSLAVSTDREISDVTDEDDAGDGKNNDLVLSCPFFRNEIGGESEELSSWNKFTTYKHNALSQTNGSPSSSQSAISSSPSFTRHPACCGVAILDSSPSPSGQILPPLVTHRGHVIEYVDHGAYYYRHFFNGYDHQNFFGTDEHLGPIAVSIRREKLDQDERVNNLGKADYGSYQYRIICRTSELTTLRGSILEDAVPSSGRLSSSRGVPVKDVLEMTLGEVQLSCLKQATPGPKTAEQLLKLDEQGICTTYKVGIMYCRASQCSEEEMYNNENGSPAFDEFLNLIGQKVRLKGFDKYRGGLDCKTDTTGLYSYYSTFNNNEIMFHVSTILPFTPNNHQQLLRKRHIGNDIVTVVFQEPGAEPFSPRSVRSQFQHVFIIIRVINPNSHNTRYSIAVSRSKDVPPFGPPIPKDGEYRKSPEFVDFLMAKVINAENAAHKSEKFRTMAQRTRQEYLKDLSANFSTSSTLDSGSKLSKFALGSGRKKERSKQKVVPDMYAKGALVWNVQVEDMSSAVQVECMLGIAADTIVLVDTASKDVIFTVPCSALIGWTLQASSIRLYFGQGECILLRPASGDMEEMTEIITRLTAVSQGTETMKLVLKRNGLGQLGFHIQSEGIVTDVEPYGFAWEVGLRKGSRLVEICKVATVTLSHDQIVDLLRTSAVVKVVVVPPLGDGTPRGLITLNSTLPFTSLLSLHNTLFDQSYCLSHHPLANQSGLFSMPHLPLAPARGDSKALPGTHSCISTPTSTTHNHHSALNSDDNHLAQGQNVNVASTKNMATSHGYSDSTLSSGRGSDDGRGSSLYSQSRQESDTYASSHNSHDGQLSSGDELHSRNNSHDSSDYSLASTGRRGPPVSSRLPQAVLRRGDGSNYQNVDSSVPSAFLTSTESIYSAVSQHSSYQGSRRHFATMEYASGSVPVTGNIALELLKQTQNTKYLLGQEAPPNAHPAPPPAPGLAQFADGGTYAGTVSSSQQLSGAVSQKQEFQRPMNRDETFLRRKESSQPRKSHTAKKYLDTSPRSSNSSPKSSHKNLSSVSSEESLNSRLRSGISTQHRGTGTVETTRANFQEELKRLINPDISEMDLATLTSKPPPNRRPGRLQRTYSDESIHSLKGSISTPSNEFNIATDLIFTTAVPKPVDITTASEQAASERLSPRAVADVSRSRVKTLSDSNRNLSDPMSLDWSDLVHVATKAIENDKRPPPPHVTSLIDKLSADSDDEAPPPPRPPSPKDDISMAANVGIPVSCWMSLSSLSTNPQQRLKEMEALVFKLQQDLHKERQQSSNLEAEIQELRADNVRLQEESQTAAAQLRRFTEWFFNTIDRQ